MQQCITAVAEIPGPISLSKCLFIIQVGVPTCLTKQVHAVVNTVSI